MKTLIRVGMAAALIVAAASLAVGVIPSAMTVQGKLTDGSGAPFSPGAKKFAFRIYDAETAGNEVWPRVDGGEQQGVTTDVYGLWTATLGEVYPLDRRVFDDIPRWLEIEVDAGGGFVKLPRVRLNSGAFAQRSGIAESAAANAVGSGAIVDGAVRAQDLAADAITTATIVDGTIASDDIAPGAITTALIADDAITSPKILDGTITTFDIGTGAVQNIDLGTNSVTSDKIANGAVGNGDLGADAVTSSKILNLSILNDDLSNSCVNSAKIFDGTIVNADINASADIAPSKIAGTAATLTTAQVFNASKHFTYNMGVGTTTPGFHKLMVESSLATVDGATAFVKNTNAAGLGLVVEATSTDVPFLVSQKGSGDILRCDSWTGGWHPVFKVKNDGYTVASVLELTGGSDLAEPFTVTASQPVEPGMVVAIDTDRPGQLKLADKAYDHTVAGIISGANGLNPGLTMRQIGTPADGTHPVALSGRVYCWVDAGFGAVAPGDLLTSSDTPGHARVVGDREAAYGAVIGKAMTALENGRGLVLVLVNLQ